ncbi:hypothetical protein KUF83_30650 [Streptomyces sp. BV286]|uniref:hypothetical protein n=1 Tax=Streptomyces sp. BV286 TaxID=2849672 RepID=UPI001C2E7120|nr:hypothetical protein [Streptomyces sp. BV286]MBV1940894.1 hypothetical protein [Streptomyces sp. BV286]
MADDNSAADSRAELSARGRRLMYLGSIALCLVGTWGFADALNRSDGRIQLMAVSALFVGAGVLGTYVTSLPAGTEAVSRQRVRDAEAVFEEALRSGLITTRSQDAQDAEPVQRVRGEGLALPELWAVTHTRLDLYHEVALGQARRSFRNAQVAMGLGFALLAVFAMVALYASTTAGAVVAGSLGAVSAALSGYVSRTFVSSQRAAASHLRAYFDQPLEFSRYLAAERIIAESGLSEEQRAEVVAAFVQAMVAGPPTTALGGTSST